MRRAPRHSVLGHGLAAIAVVAIAALASLGCVDASADDSELRELVVEASAYTSRAVETDGEPGVAAWGDSLDPDVPSIAVSRDLLELGLGHRAKVEIEGFDGELVVLDKMASRWQRRIDIYMGLDHERARDWGVRRVKIRWRVPNEH